MTLPRTDLDVLLSHLVGERLDLDAGTLARHLPLLDEVVATTANGSALISELGTYAEPTFTGEAFGVRADAVTLRLSRPAVAAVVATRPTTSVASPPRCGCSTATARPCTAPICCRPTPRWSPR